MKCHKLLHALVFSYTSQFNKPRLGEEWAGAMHGLESLFQLSDVIVTHL
jgi:hypothetical protein